MAQKKLIAVPNGPLIMTKEYWMTSQFSLARYYGHITINQHRFVIVNKDGRDIFQCNSKAIRNGHQYAINPNEPADLIWDKLIPDYRRLGRDRIIQLIKEHKGYEEIHNTPS